MCVTPISGISGWHFVTPGNRNVEGIDDFVEGIDGEIADVDDSASNSSTASQNAETRSAGSAPVLCLLQIRCICIQAPGDSKPVFGNFDKQNIEGVDKNSSTPSTFISSNSIFIAIESPRACCSGRAAWLHASALIGTQKELQLLSGA